MLLSSMDTSRTEPLENEKQAILSPTENSTDEMQIAARAQASKDEELELLLPQSPTLNKTIPAKRKMHPSIIPAHPLSTSRYTRQLLLPQISIAGHQRISSSRALIVGLGGLGCPAALYLASAGVGTLGLLDSDTVELSNLHRQVLHREDSVGWTKVRSAIRGLKDVNSEVEYVGYEESFTPANAIDIARQYDIILDCTDNPQTRYLINDVAVALGKTVVSAAAQKMEGQSLLLNYPVGQGPCYRCIFPRSPKADMVVSCEEVGVFGPAVGTMGVIMAGEAIRILVQGLDAAINRKPSMLLYNAWSDTMFRTVRLRGKRKGCIACGDPADLKDDENKITAEAIQEGRFDYVAFCGTREDVKVLSDQERMSAKRFLESSSASERIIVDVREPHEFALGAQVKGSINIPISQILSTSPGDQQPLDAEDGNRPTWLLDVQGSREVDNPINKDTDYPASLIFLCQKGNDSQIAVKKFMDSGLNTGSGWNWIGDVKGGLDAILLEDPAGG